MSIIFRSVCLIVASCAIVYILGSHRVKLAVVTRSPIGRVIALISIVLVTAMSPLLGIALSLVYITTQVLPPNTKKYRMTQTVKPQSSPLPHSTDHKNGAPYQAHQRGYAFDNLLERLATEESLFPKSSTTLIPTRYSHDVLANWPDGFAYTSIAPSSTIKY